MSAPTRRGFLWLVTVLGFATALLTQTVSAQDPASDPRPAPPRAEREGPFERLVIRNASVIDGTGAPPRGPVDIVVEGNRITSVAAVGATAGDMRPGGRPGKGTNEIYSTGMYVLPGLVDLHVHNGDLPKTPQSEYVYKLWMAHGITSARGVPFASPDFSASEKARSARNEITAPRMFTYRLPFDEWEGTIETPEKAREWVRAAAKTGIDGIKLTAYPPDIMAALLDEAKKLGLGFHRTPLSAGRRRDECHRRGPARSRHGHSLLRHLRIALRRARRPALAAGSQPRRRAGPVRTGGPPVGPDSQAGKPGMEGSPCRVQIAPHHPRSHHDRLPCQSQRHVPPQRRLAREVHPALSVGLLFAIARQPRLLLLRLDQLGRGRVAELLSRLDGVPERLQEHGRKGHGPLEVIRGATLHAAQALFEPKGKPIEFGVVRAGLLADLLIVPENPVANLKVLYGTGAARLNDKTGKPERVGGIKYTIKDGIVYDARKLLADVARMVEKQKKERGITRLPSVDFPPDRR